MRDWSVMVGQFDLGLLFSALAFIISPVFSWRVYCVEEYGWRFSSVAVAEDSFDP